MTIALVTAMLLTGCTPRVTETPAVAGRVVTGSLHYLIVRGAASRVDVRLAEIPGLLYRVSTPAGSGLAPQVTGGEGTVRVGLRPTGDSGPDVVTILLNRRVRWDIRLPSGAGEQRLDLAGGNIARVALGPSGLVDITLPEPVGTVPVLLVGEVGDARFRGYGPVRVAVRERVALTQPGWVGATDRYLVRAHGLGRLAVTNRSSPAAG